MIQNVYSVYDQAAEAYLPPFFCRTHGEALRMFTSAVRDSDHQFHKHASDYALYHVGTWTESLGSLEGIPPFHLGNAVEYLTEDGIRALG